MKLFTRSLLAVVAMSAIGGTASASTQIVGCTTASGPTELSAASVLCPRFNVAGGTLTSISITISGAVSGTVTLTNGSSTTKTAAGTTAAQYTVGALQGFSFVNPLFTLSFTTGIRTQSSGETLSVSGLIGIGGSAPIGPNTTNFAPYAGAGSFVISVSTSTSFSWTGEGGFTGATQATSANASATVTYTYSP